MRSKFTRWPPSWIWAFQVSGPPQLLRVPLTIVYTCQDHVLESLKMTFFVVIVDTCNWLQIFQNDSKICEAEFTVTPLINKICKPWIRMRELKKRRFWATHANQKWCLFPHNRTWSYQICIVKCLYFHRGHLLENVGKTTLHSNPKFSFELTCVAQKRLYLSSLLFSRHRRKNNKIKCTLA